MDDSAARLACYDALARRGAAPGIPAAAPAASTAPAAPAQPAAAPAPGAFGLPKPTPEDKEPRQITAHVVGSLREWKKGTVIKLDNGQVWKVSGDGEGYYPDVPDNPEVTIKQSLFGSYWMEIAGAGRSVKVKRIS